MTIQALARARRLTKPLNQIREDGAVDQAAFEYGYESHSGFPDAFVRMFGSTADHRKNCDCVFLQWIPTPLGPLITGATDKGVCLVEFGDRRRLNAQFAVMRKRFDLPLVPGSHRHLAVLRKELNLYFERKLQEFSVPLVYPGTPFQTQVWKALLAIPYGQTRSYEQLAIAVGQPRAVRAVGRTNGLNRIAIIIPCHRVVNKNGESGGYGGGLRRKQFLLELERGAHSLFAGIKEPHPHKNRRCADST